jgi:hypothetical protein
MIRRILADAVDPGRHAEVRDLRERAVIAEGARRIIEARLLQIRIERTVETAICEARIAEAEAVAEELRADVARLLEQGAACAHEHTEDGR